MNDLIDPAVREPAARRLAELTGLVPLGFSIPWLTEEWTEFEISPSDHQRLLNVIGFATFVLPNVIEIGSVLSGFDCRSKVSTIDAAAYCLEPPEGPAIDENYRGEAMRFVAVEWGAFSSLAPLVLRVRAKESFSVRPHLNGFVVGEVVQPMNAEISETMLSRRQRFNRWFNRRTMSNPVEVPDTISGYFDRLADQGRSLTVPQNGERSRPELDELAGQPDYRPPPGWEPSDS